MLDSVQLNQQQQADYPRYGVTGPSKQRQHRPARYFSDPRLNQLKYDEHCLNGFQHGGSSGGGGKSLADMDARMASSAQLFHYQQTKKQLLAMSQKWVAKLFILLTC